MPLEPLQLRKRPRVLATDVDGTLTAPGDVRLHPGLIDAFTRLRAAGVRVMLVTGRPAGWVQALFRYLPVDGAVAEGGAVLFPGCEEPVAHLAAQRSPRANRIALMRNLALRWPQLRETPDNAFRLVDAAFDRAPFSAADLAEIRSALATEDLQFTYSTVHGHLMPPGIHKASGIAALLELDPAFAGCTTADVLTVGDSPNDDEMFDPELFPYSVGVAGIRAHAAEFRWLPRWITTADAGDGFLELVDAILRTPS